jgi:hypothetical protein
MKRPLDTQTAGHSAGLEAGAFATQPYSKPLPALKQALLLHGSVLRGQVWLSLGFCLGSHEVEVQVPGTLEKNPLSWARVYSQHMCSTQAHDRGLLGTWLP